MGIPLVRNNSVDDINTSIIAIKKELGKGGSGDMGDVNVNVDVKYEVTDTVEDGNSLPVTSNGVSRVINVLGVPVGCILSFYGNTVPESFLPCNGVAFDENQYPALYALLGDNHTPYSYDKSRLGDYEEITISTDANNPTVMQYDGYVKIIAGTSSGVTGAGITIEMYVNGNLASKYNVSSGSPTNFLATVSAEVKKGDEVYYKLTNMVITKTLARFYTHFNVIKATSGL
jgi:hypothetical protein